MPRRFEIKKQSQYETGTWCYMVIDNDTDEIVIGGLGQGSALEKADRMNKKAHRRAIDRLRDEQKANFS